MNSEKRDISLVANFVLDILHYDIETIETLLNHLNDSEAIGWRKFWRHDFTRADVLPALEELLAGELVQALVYNENAKQLERVPRERVSISEEANSLWFAITNKGRKVWEAWTPPD